MRPTATATATAPRPSLSPSAGAHTRRGTGAPHRLPPAARRRPPLPRARTTSDPALRGATQPSSDAPSPRHSSAWTTRARTRAPRARCLGLALDHDGRGQVAPWRRRLRGCRGRTAPRGHARRCRSSARPRRPRCDPPRPPRRAGRPGRTRSPRSLRGLRSRTQGRAAPGRSRRARRASSGRGWETRPGSPRAHPSRRSGA